MITRPPLFCACCVVSCAAGNYTPVWFARNTGAFLRKYAGVIASALQCFWGKKF